MVKGDSLNSSLMHHNNIGEHATCVSLHLIFSSSTFVTGTLNCTLCTSHITLFCIGHVGVPISGMVNNNTNLRELKISISAIDNIEMLLSALSNSRSLEKLVLCDIHFYTCK